jgi:ABC-type transport system involved in multi-copper enzyme maturation permease subunit
MYFWKCWRDTRSRYFTLLFSCVLLAVAVSGSLMFHYGTSRGFKFNPPRTPSEIDTVWGIACEEVGVLASFLAAGLGAALGAAGLGEELQNGTAAFLLTRPRPRAYFLNVRWAVAIAQLAAFSISVALALFATLFLCTHRVGSLWFISVGVIFFTFSLLSFAMTDLFTLVRENVRDGVAIALFISVAWLLAVPVVNIFWRLDLPTPTNLFVALLSPRKTWLGLWDMAGWLALSLALVLPAQYVLKRKEI